MRAGVGIVGRYVMHKFKRGEYEAAKEVDEPCEVVACERGQYEWQLLVATYDGYLFPIEGVRELRFVPEPGNDGGPYR